MITITLTDQEALDYLAQKTEVLEVEPKSKDTTTNLDKVTGGLSARSLERMKRLAEEPEEEQVQEEIVIPTSTKVSTGKAWANWEVQILKDSIASTNQVIRHLKYLYKHLPARSDAAIRSRLNHLGAKVKKGYII